MIGIIKDREAINEKGKNQAVAREIRFWNNAAYNKLGNKRLKHIRETRLFNSLKVGFDGKFKLVDKYLFENTDIILFIKDQHRFFVIDRINGPE